jgi:hypothetical protein
MRNKRTRNVSKKSRRSKSKYLGGSTANERQDEIIEIIRRILQNDTQTTNEKLDELRGKSLTFIGELSLDLLRKCVQFRHRLERIDQDPSEQVRQGMIVLKMTLKKLSNYYNLVSDVLREKTSVYFETQN